MGRLDWVRTGGWPFEWWDLDTRAVMYRWPLGVWRWVVVGSARGKTATREAGMREVERVIREHGLEVSDGK